MEVILFIMWCLVWVSIIVLGEIKKRKQINQKLKVIEEQNVKSTISCSNYNVDASYDELINKIIYGGKPIKIEENYLWFLYKDRAYGIWISNKDCAYGSKLVGGCSKDELIYKKYLVDNRGLRQETLNKLYEKEIEFIGVNGAPITIKEKEDKLIAQLLSDSEA